MSIDLPRAALAGLERSCNDGESRRDWVRLATGSRGIERAEAHFGGQAFAPHRHDTYVVGLTTRGVQCFDYRGSLRRSLPGQFVVLHPDEQHDGRPGTETGFGFKVIYLDPSLVHASAPGRPLPFAADPVVRDERISAMLRPAFDEFDEDLDELAAVDLVAGLTAALRTLCGTRSRRCGSVDAPALVRAREFLLAAPYCSRLRVEALEAEAGLDRWRLSRQFRRAFGTSPYRFFQLRRVKRARALIEQGVGIAAAAVETGFADQSHLTRQFKRTYGLSPGRWAAITGGR